MNTLGTISLVLAAVIPAAAQFLAKNDGAPTDGWDGPGRGSYTLCYNFREPFSIPSLPDAGANRAVARAALAKWSSYIQVDFVECPTATAQSLDTVYISFETWMPITARAAAGGPKDTNMEPEAGNIWLNGNHTWGPGYVDGDLYAILVHELGHVLGLEHRTDVISCMYVVFDPQQPYYAWMRSVDPSPGDIAAVQTLYGSRQPTAPEGGRCERDNTCGTPQPPALSITASVPATVPGYTAPLTGTVTGGTAPYTLTWTTPFNQSSITYANPYSATVFVQYGVNLITVRVVDAMGREATVTVQVTAGIGG